MKDPLPYTTFLWPKLSCIYGSVRPAANLISLTCIATPARHGALMSSSNLLPLIHSKFTYSLAKCWVLFLFEDPNTLILIDFFFQGLAILLY